MLPIALTCPLWWVARWTARVLASLAVVVACSLGTATLPLAPAATAHSAPRTGGSPDASTPPGSAVAGQARRALINWSDRAAGRARVDSGPTVRTGAGIARVDSGPSTRAGAGTTDRGAADRPVAASGMPAPVPPRQAVVVPFDRHRVLTGLAPATTGSRAPPAR